MAPGDLEEIKKLLPSLKDCAEKIERLFLNAEEYKYPEKYKQALEDTVRNLKTIGSILNEIQIERVKELEQVENCRLLLSATLLAIELRDYEGYLKRFQDIPKTIKETYNLLSKFVRPDENNLPGREKDAAHRSEN